MRIIERQLIYTEAPTPECHASTIVELPDGGLLAAWFGGLYEKASDVGIWGSRRPPGVERWSKPQLWADEPEVPCWNPVLFLDGDAVRLFYKVGPTIPGWTGCSRDSRDGGVTWGPIEWLPAGLLGPIKNKPIRLTSGEILCGTSVEAYSTWACWAELIHADGRWGRFGPILPPPAPHQPKRIHGLIQPTVWESRPGHLRALMRPSPGLGRIYEATSDDYGRSWTAAKPTALPNPNSGIDAVRLADGRVALAYNPTTEGRTPISLSLSEDDGETWGAPLELESGPGEFSYPAIIQTADGRLHVTYTHHRTRIAHAVIDPSP